MINTILQDHFELLVGISLDFVSGTGTFSSILVSQKHETLFDQFSGIFTENKQHEQSLADYLETLLMLQYNNKDNFSINQS